MMAEVSRRTCEQQAQREMRQREMDVERTPVVGSSNLASVGYSQSSRTLEVEFHGGRVYLYFEVPANVYEDLMRASSKGSYHAEHIKYAFRYHEVK